MSLLPDWYRSPSFQELLRQVTPPTAEELAERAARRAKIRRDRRRPLDGTDYLDEVATKLSGELQRPDSVTAEDHVAALEKALEEAVRSRALRTVDLQTGLYEQPRTFVSALRECVRWEDVRAWLRNEHVAPSAAAPTPKPRKKTAPQQHGDVIHDTVVELGYSPLKLPQHKNGGPGLRSHIWKHLEAMKPPPMGFAVFGKNWDRLFKEGRLAYVTAPSDKKS